jgi:hypothetical protein
MRRGRVAPRVIALGVVGLVVLSISAVGVWLGLHMSGERWGRPALARDASVSPRNVTAPLDAAPPPDLRRGADRDAGVGPDAVRRRVRLKKRPAPAAAKLMVVTVSGGTVLWSEVYVDGKKRGQTPCPVSLAPGLHAVEVRRPGYLPRSTRVVLRPGQEKTLRLELKALTRGSDR